MDHCPKCKSLLRTGISFTTNEDDVEYTNIPLFCLNKDCDNYAGNTLDIVKQVDIVKNRVN